MGVVLVPRRGKPRLGDFVMRRHSGGEGYASLEEVYDAMAPLFSAFGIGSVPPAGSFKITNLYVMDGKLVVEYDDET